MNDFFSIQDLIPKGIDCGFRPEELQISDGSSISICVLKVSGHYPKGSAGAFIGEYLSGLSVFLREIYRLDALVIDLSGLDYKWGNNLLRVAAPETLQTHSAHNTWLGYFIIGSDTNKNALHSLFCDFGKSSEIREIFLSRQTAINQILNEANRM
ncbi:hypothetical protein JXA05_04110 [Candidatus Peregrinibacteria bacterium]|nr:hypothetical protein [Candidatus Peregrinibacteria bacterium]